MILTHFCYLYFTSCQAAKKAAEKEALEKKIKASAAKKAKKDAAAKVRHNDCA